MITIYLLRPDIALRRGLGAARLVFDHWRRSEEQDDGGEEDTGNHEPYHPHRGTRPRVSM